MKFATYYEENSTINYDEYEKLKKAVLLEHPKKKTESMTVKKLRFINASESIVPQDDSIPRYYLCMKDHKDNSIYIEKKSIQDQVIYKNCMRVTKEECEKILNGDIEWMKNHKRPLIADFYLQITINGLEPGYITEYTRELMQSSKNGHVTFNKKVQRVAGRNVDLFGNDYIMINCLSEGKVYLSYKKEIVIPSFLDSILEMPEEWNNDYAFAF